MTPGRSHTEFLSEFPAFQPMFGTVGWNLLSDN
jgi:hypothetical protein